MADILLAILEILGWGKPNFELVRDMDESDAYIEFELNPMKMRTYLYVKEPNGQMDGHADKANTVGLLPSAVSRVEGGNDKKLIVYQLILTSTLFQMTNFRRFQTQRVCR